MMIQAEREGGSGASVAASHSVRIMMVVVTIPFIYRALDLHGTDPYVPAVKTVHYGGLLALAALTLAGAVAVDRLRSPNNVTPAFDGSATRIVVSSVAVTVVAMLACSAFGWIVGRLSGVSPATMILATSPGGIAEMSLTARTLELGVPMVTAFHATRMAALVIFIGPVYRLMRRRGDEDRGE